jgi:microcystin-dependent protein
MATSNYSWNLPTVGGSEDTWGTSLNANWTALDTLLGGVTQTEFALLSGQTSLVPAGVILLWSGSIATIPSGWNLCDGTNGTPDLRNRFVVAAGDTYAVGATGGADSVTLDASQMPAHTHTFSGSTNTTGAHTHTVAAGNSSGGSNIITTGNARSNDTSYTTSSAGDHSHTFSGTTASTGGGGSHENRPPYYALAYIQKA